MTPLALRIVRELTLPVKDRRFDDQAGLLKRMGDVHCFDVSDVIPLIEDLAERWAEAAFREEAYQPDPTLAFLPAPKTWVEFRRSSTDREGVLLIDHAGGKGVAKSVWARACPRVFMSSPRVGMLTLREGLIAPGAKQWAVREVEVGMSLAEMAGWNTWVYAALAVINSPKVIGQKQHAPHRGLERRLVAAMGPQGTFPLHAWTEIKLEALARPRDLSDAEPFDAHLTGRRALHFCRQHIRIVNGRLVWVRAHWRGDASLGIKRSRYRVVPPPDPGGGTA